MPECPLCFATVPQASLQAHVNRCLDSAAAAPDPVVPHRALAELERARAVPAIAPPAPPPERLNRAASWRVLHEYGGLDVPHDASESGGGGGAGAGAGAGSLAAAAALERVTGVLTVGIVCASHLTKHDILSTSDPYCVVDFEGLEQTTQWKPTTKSPTWNEDFSFPVDEFYAQSAITIKVYNKKYLRRGSPMGTLKLTLGQVVDRQVALLKPPSGASRHASAAAAAGLGTPSSLSVPSHLDALDDKDPVWERPDPLRWDAWHDLEGGGRIRLRLEFFARDRDVRQTVGPKRLNVMHRICGSANKQALTYFRGADIVKEQVISQLYDMTTVDGLTGIQLVASATGNDVGAAEMLRSLLDFMTTNDKRSEMARFYLGGTIDSSPRTSALHWAAHAGNVAALDVLMTNSFLTYASSLSSKSDDKIKLLTRKDADGHTPFTVACKHGHTGMAKRILETLRRCSPPPGADLDMLWGDGICAPPDGVTPLFAAAQGGHADVVREVFQDVAEAAIVDARRPSDGATALMAAAGSHNRAGATLTVKVLIEIGASVKRTDNRGRTPLHYAAAAGNFQLSEALVQGVDAAARDVEGNTAHALAAMGSSDGHRAVAALLKPFEKAVDIWDAPDAEDEDEFAPADDDYGYDEDGGGSGGSEDGGGGGGGAAGAGADDEAAARASMPAGPPTMVPWTGAPDGEWYAVGDSSEGVKDTGPSAASGPEIPMAPPRLMKSKSTEVMREEDVAHERMLLIRHVADVLRVPLSTAGVLVRAYKWSVDDLVMAMVTDRDAAMRDAHVKPPSASQLLDAWLNPSEEEECEICMDDFAAADIFALGCQHKICVGCWKSDLSAQLKRLGPEVVTKSACPHAGCGAVLDESVWQTLASPEDNARYEKLMLSSFVDLDDRMVWCPKPDCNRAVRYTGTKADVTCDCGCRFCFSCHEEPHSPLSCTLLKQWKDDKTRVLDNASYALLMKNYKRCPKCKTFIERNKGCNHMTCYVSSCKYEWCWLCKGPWSEHGSGTGGYYRCNKYEKERGANKGVMHYEKYSEEELSKLSAADAAKARQKQLDDMTKTLAQFQLHDTARELCEQRLTAFEQQAGIAPKTPAGGGPDGADESKSSAGDGSIAAAISKAANGGGGLMSVIRLAARIRHGVTRSMSGGSNPSGGGAASAAAPTSGPAAGAGEAGGYGIATGASYYASRVHGDAGDAARSILLRRLDTVRDALIALSEFHRVEQWTTVHLYYARDGPAKDLLVYKQETLERHADHLFAMTDPAIGLNKVNEPRLRAMANATSKFCKALTQEIDFEDAFGRGAAASS